MRRSTIGPLALSDGLQLRAPEGSAGGLLRACNVERRDGLVRTRLGSELIGVTRAHLDGLAVTARAYLNDAGGVAEPNMAGKNQIVICMVAAAGIAPGTHVELFVRPGVANATATDYTVEYLSSVTGAWRELEFADTNRLLGNFDPESGIPLSNTTTKAINVYFIAPVDWISEEYDAAMGSGYNVRIRFNQPMSVGSTFQSLARVPTSDVALPTLAFVSSRAGRSLWGLASTPLASTVSSYFTTRDSAAGTRLLTTKGATNNAGPTAYNILYVPYTNHVLLSDGLGAYVTPADENPHTAAVPFVPRTVGSGDPTRESFPEYADIPLETVLPGFSAVIIVGQRVLIGGIVGDECRLRWSAPAEAWEHWPTENTALLGSAATGGIVAFAESDGSVVVFTKRDIFMVTFAEGLGDEESNVIIERLEETGCPARKSVVVVDGGIAFMSDDGPRLLRGRGPSKPLVRQVTDLFRADGITEFACVRKSTTCAVWDKARNRLLFSYTSSGGPTNDTILVVDMDQKTAWLWGSPEPVAGDSVSAGQQRARGLRCSAMVWDPEQQAVAAISQDGLLFYIAGESDLGMPIPAFLETQTLRLGAVDLCVVERVDLGVLRDRWDEIDVSVIPDGNGGRKDTRRLGPDPDRINASSSIGGASLVPSSEVDVVDIDNSFGPVKARFRKKCRNFRVRVESVAPDHGGLAVFAVTAVFSAEGGKR